MTFHHPPGFPRMVKEHRFGADTFFLPFSPRFERGSRCSCSSGIGRRSGTSAVPLPVKAALPPTLVPVKSWREIIGTIPGRRSELVKKEIRQQGWIIPD